MKRRIISISVVFAVLLSLYFIRTNFYNNGYTADNNGDISNHSDISSDGYGQLKVHYIDVGQGDSCFIELPNGDTMLIDGGQAKYGVTVSNYIASLGYNDIDFLIATHGDADHIGSLPKIFEDFEVESCYTSYVPSKTKTYQYFLEAVEDEGIELLKAYSGEYIIDEQNFDIKVIGPNKAAKQSDTNDASVVILVSFYNYDFLFTGDASSDVLENYNIGDIEVLKASHHGSKTGVSEELVNELSPEYSVISVAAKNRYNHPHSETLELLKNSEIYMTSEFGNITAVCDKSSLEFVTEK